MTTRIPENRCPECNYMLDAASSIEDESAKPAEGDITLCMKCTAILVFGKDFKLTPATEEQIGELDHDVRMQIQRLRRAITKAVDPTQLSSR